ncbi:DUF2306 domain-containing protein [Xylanibacillus composti]|uniref:DUF2306 domain-containing protein n=1 Tax=Xylanibacillus composti TaxID=1572762 RepID=A0A8J4H1C7_9BACL|nr:DUF2306 domain-containing protein [Xylanibacillus composti]MDT9725373.1 DUF2306 domain-containing protein [Xylanibacillus composti]GIQ69137.1 hypothetical protein XYCOK13_19610 [Xylanibacillus composti]
MKKNMGIVLLIVSFMWVMHTLSKNFMVDPAFQDFLAKKDAALTNESLWVLMIRFHIIFAIISLITGPLGVIKKLRIKSVPFHRWNGRVYVLSILLNVIPGVYVSFFATGGWLSTIGFLVLSTLWFGTTILGYIHIRRKNVLKHSSWMSRSFFLTFANMFIYILVAISHNALQLSYATSYTIAVWLCWVISWCMAEIMIRKKVFI